MQRRFNLTIAVAGMAFFAAACSASQATAPTKDDLLAQAGFVRKDADTPERVAVLRALPPHHFVMRNSGGSVKYLYADPNVCVCIYVGGQRAYDQYRQMMASQVADTQIRAILSNAPLPIGAGFVESGR